MTVTIAYYWEPERFIETETIDYKRYFSGVRWNIDAEGFTDGSFAMGKPTRLGRHYRMVLFLCYY